MNLRSNYSHPYRWAGLALCGLAACASIEGQSEQVVEEVPMTASPEVAPVQVEPVVYQRRSWFGYASKWIDDVDGDGWPDLAVPDYTYLPSASTVNHSGLVMILSGQDGHVIRVLESGGNNRGYGWAVAPTGDLDSDGVDELLIQGRQGTAFVRAVSPVTGEVFWQTDGLPEWNSICGMEVGVDFDGDGARDVLVFGGQTDRYSSDPGLVMLSGKTGEMLYQNETFVDYWSIILGACFVDDLDGDGLADFAVAKLEDRPDGDRVGSIDLRSGATGALLRSLYSVSKPGRLGSTLRAADLDGDGTKELLVGFSSPGSKAILVLDVQSGAELDRIFWRGMWKDSGSMTFALSKGTPASGATSSAGESKLRTKTWPLSDQLVVVGDTTFWVDEVRAYSLGTGAWLWTAGGYSPGDYSGDLGDYLGYIVEASQAPNPDGSFSILAGTANPYGGSNHCVWSINAGTGKLNFIVDETQAYDEVGLEIVTEVFKQE